MPEGPEIKRAADAIAKAVVYQPITEIFFAFEHLKPYESTLAEATVIAVEPRGKALLTRFSNQLNIYSHNQLYGIWNIRRPYAYPKTKRQLRLAIDTTKASALLYSASDIDVLPDTELANHPFLKRIGPDVLHPETTATQIVQRLTNKSFYRRRLSTLLLDQQFLSGLGNYLRSEILFVAGVHPSLRPVDCTDEQIVILAQMAIALPRQSYETGGITNDLDRVARLKSDGFTRSQYRYFVFSRANKPCYECGTTIVKDRTGGRRYYYCPTCQPLPETQ
ncbi:MAG: endonuclease VIII [Leptolyngbyaceae bacterium]|nr:endonuclease VIII [Leptolyngbyaceae bacterium]